MSFGKGRGLEFEAKVPAFLQRLKGGIATGQTDRHEHPVPRPKRLKQDDEDDAPTYVVEDSNDTLSKAEYEGLLAGKEVNNDSNSEERDHSTDAKDASDDRHGEENSKRDAVANTDRVAEAGKLQKKRKVGKVVGGEEEEAVDDKKPSNSDATKKPRKKAKAIKLSFDED